MVWFRFRGTSSLCYLLDYLRIYLLVSSFGIDTVGEVVIMLAFHVPLRLMKQAARVRFPNGVILDHNSLFNEDEKTHHGIRRREPFLLVQLLVMRNVTDHSERR